MVCRTSYIYKLQICDCWMLQIRTYDFPGCRGSDALLLSFENRRHKAIKRGVGDKSSIAPPAAVAAVELVHINFNPGSLIWLFLQLLDGVSYMENPCWVWYKRLADDDAFQGGCWCRFAAGFEPLYHLFLCGKNVAVAFSRHCTTKCCSFFCHFLSFVVFKKKIVALLWGHDACQQNPLEGLDETLGDIWNSQNLLHSIPFMPFLTQRGVSISSGYATMIGLRKVTQSSECLK